MLAELEAIDATLRGEPVDPVHAELAELALLVAASRPQMPAEAAEAHDAKIARRFVPLSAGPQAGGSEGTLSQGPSGTGGGRGSSRWSRASRAGHWARRPALAIGVAAMAAACAVAGVLVLHSGSGSVEDHALSQIPARAGAVASSASSSASSSGGSAGGSFGGSGGGVSYSGTPTPGTSAAKSPGSVSQAVSSRVATTSASSTAGSSQAAQAPVALAPPNAAPTPVPNGRKTIQSAQLQLMAAAARIDQVSQELFTVVGNESGIVKSSTITSGSGAGGYASFQLSIPSGNLADTMQQLSALPYAHVVSRTDQSQDVNDQYLSDVRALADAQALHTALLKQLANAYTQAQIDGLTGQIKDAEATIAADQTTLGSLNERIAFSPLQVQINAGAVIVPPPSGGSSSGFTLGRAWHDALRVLTVTAGVGLIVLAALLPIAVLVALLTWAVHLQRAYRREAALRSA